MELPDDDVWGARLAGGGVRPRATSPTQGPSPKSQRRQPPAARRCSPSHAPSVHGSALLNLRDVVPPVPARDPDPRRRTPPAPSSAGHRAAVARSSPIPRPPYACIQHRHLQHRAPEHPSLPSRPRPRRPHIAPWASSACTAPSTTTRRRATASWPSPTATCCSSSTATPTTTGGRPRRRPAPRTRRSPRA